MVGRALCSWFPLVNHSTDLVFLCFRLVFFDLCFVFWIRFRGGAPIIPMKGLPEGFVQLLVHGSHYPISIENEERGLWFA